MKFKFIRNIVSIFLLIFTVLNVEAAFLDFLTRDSENKEYPKRQATIKEIAIPIESTKILSDSCSKNSLLNGKQISTKIITKNTFEKKKFYDILSLKSYSGIIDAKLSTNKLSITLVSKALVEEFEGPIYDVISQDHYEASPGTALVGHTLTLGLGLIFMPGNSLQHAFGCTDEQLIRKEINISESYQTYKSRWVDANFEAAFRIVGFDKPLDYKFMTQSTDGIATVEIDLTDTIKNNNFTENTDLFISCTTCDLSAQHDYKAANKSEENINKIFKISHDFNPQKLALIKLEELRIETEKKNLEKKIQLEKSIKDFESKLIGRWSTKEICIAKSKNNVGLFYVRNKKGSISQMVVNQNSGSFQTYGESEFTQIEPNEYDGRSFLVTSNLTLSKNNYQYLIKSTYTLTGNELNIVQDINNSQKVGLEIDGESVATLVNCSQPSIIAEKARLNQIEQDHINKIKQDEAERRRKQELEIKDRAKKADELDKLFKM